MPSGDIKEVKAGYSWRYVGLTAIVTILGALISGAVGYGINEYTRDRKVLEVTTRSSGNLASVPIAASSNLDITLLTPNGREPIKSLIRYDVRISNRSEQGADDFNVFLQTPNSIELVETPTITTVPPELRNAIDAKPSRGPSGNYRLTVNLLNPSQSITVGYLGFSRTEFVTGTAPLNVVVSKKDWTQRNVADEATPDGKFSGWKIILTIIVGLAGLIGGLFFMRVAWKEQKKTNDSLASMGEDIRALGDERNALRAERDALIAERDELRERLSNLAPTAETPSQDGSPEDVRKKRVRLAEIMRETAKPD